MSDSVRYLWWLLPAVRKRKDQSRSVLFGLLDAVGTVLDELKTAILTARLRRYVLVRNPDHPYYASDMRSADLDWHALDRGLRRLAGESDAALLERIVTLPYRNRFLGAKSGIKYLIEDIHKLQCDQVVEYYADDQAWVVFSRGDQECEVEINLSHVFNSDDMGIYDAYRQTRIYSRTDLSRAFHFWVSISNPQGIAFDPEVVVEAVNAVKPAHTRAVVHFTDNQLPAD